MNAQEEWKKAVKASEEALATRLKHEQKNNIERVDYVVLDPNNMMTQRVLSTYPEFVPESTKFERVFIVDDASKLKVNHFKNWTQDQFDELIATRQADG